MSEAVRDKTVSGKTASGDIWVYAQMQQDGAPAPVVYELLGLGKRLAAESGKKLCAVLPGYGKRQSAEELAARGADVVWLAEQELLGEYSADAYTDVLTRLIRSEQPDIVLFGGTDEGRELAPRTAARLGTGLTVDCTELTIDKENGQLRQIRPAFGSRLMAEIRTRGNGPQMCTVRPGMFEKAEQDDDKKGLIREVSVSLKSGQIRTKVLETRREETCVGLEAAKVVVAGGMGIGGAEGFDLLSELAEALGGAVGGTRAALNEGWISHDRMIGQTGTVVAPDLYIACGISGAVQHMLGVSGAKCIVAVNTSPDAPIFETADYGIVADYREFIPVLLKELKKTQG